MKRNDNFHILFLEESRSILINDRLIEMLLKIIQKVKLNTYISKLMSSGILNKILKPEYKDKLKNWTTNAKDN